MTPVKFKSQLDVHKYIIDQKTGAAPEESAYIDQIPNW